MSDQRRVVITGMGWITPLGHDLETVWSRLVGGQSGVRTIDRFDASTFPTTFAAQVRDYDFTRYVRDPEIHRTAGAHRRAGDGGRGAGCYHHQASEHSRDPRCSRGQKAVRDHGRALDQRWLGQRCC